MRCNVHGASLLTALLALGLAGLVTMVGDSEEQIPILGIKDIEV